MELLTMIASLLIMGTGVIEDIQSRKFPNRILVCCIALGLLNSLIRGQAVQAFFIFLAINFLGILAYEFKLLSPGDVKFASVCIFFLDLSSVGSIVVFLTSILAIGLGYGLLYPMFRYSSREERRAHYRSEIDHLRYFVYSPGIVSKTYATHEQMKENTHPFTLQLYIAFLITVAVCSL